jgi:hypothetical protein
LSTRSTTATLTTLTPNSTYCFRARSRNRALVETPNVALGCASTTDTVAVVSNYAPGVWSNATPMTFSATGADHYYYLFDLSPNTNANQTSNVLTSPHQELPGSGTYYFHIAGYDPANQLVGGLVHYGPLRVDLIAPLTSAPRASGVSAAATVQFTWSDLSSDRNLSPTSGYSYGVVRAVVPADRDIEPPDTILTVQPAFTHDFSAETAGEFYVRVKARDEAGNWGPSQLLTYRYTAPAPAVPNDSRPVGNLMRLGSGRPLTLEYSIAERGRVRARLFTLRGEPVKTLVDRDQDAGASTVSWSGADADGRLVASGVYLLVVEGPGYKKVHKVAVLK